MRVARTIFLKDSWTRKAIHLSYDFPAEVQLDSHGIYLSNLGLRIRKNTFEFVLDGFDHLRNLSHRCAAVFRMQDDLLFVEVGGIMLNITTAEEAFIASEIFVTGTYQFTSKGPFVVVDVGMNVGFAALSFASRADVSKVYGFEPFADTYEQAMRNIRSNPQLAEKIEAFNYGLSDAAGSLTVDYDYDNKGQVGIYGTSLIASKVGSITSVDIMLKDAFSELERIIHSHARESIVLKVDCEGAEYGIVRTLYEHDLLRHFRLLCIEWHERGPDDLVAWLSASGFSVFAHQSPTKKVGMIYAAR